MRHAFDVDGGADWGTGGGWAPGISLETFARASHELRQPLSGILGHVAALRRPGLDADEQGQRLLHIQRAASHMAQVLDAALELSAISLGSAGAGSELVDAADQARQVAGMLRPLAEAKGITLQVSRTQGSADCMASRRRLTQVLLNLVGNAVQHCGRGTRVSIGVDCAGARWLTLQVDDDGPGIGPHHLARVFQPFYRAGGEGGEGTCGLGLAIVRALVLQMGGEVEVRSTPGCGTRFAVRLPRVA